MAVAQAACNKQSQCSTLYAAINMADMNTCIAQIANACIQTTSTNDVTYGDASAAACAQAYATLSCDDFFTGNLPAACTPGGNRANGAACGDDFQCPTGSFCSRTSLSACGTCTALPALGQACQGPCGGGLQCVCAAGQSSCTTGTCQQYRKLGEMCDGNFSCLPSLACAKGVCTTPMVGQACTYANPETDCSQLQLQYCDMSSMTCIPIPLTVASLGDPCYETSTMLFSCGLGLYCRMPNNAVAGVCAKLPTAGQPCGGNDGMSCNDPATCVSGTCQNFDPNTCK